MNERTYNISFRMIMTCMLTVRSVLLIYLFLDLFKQITLLDSPSPFPISGCLSSHKRASRSLFDAMIK